MEQEEIGAEYQKWVCKLLGYDFEIRFKAGKTNKVALDSFSLEQFQLGALQ